MPVVMHRVKLRNDPNVVLKKSSKWILERTVPCHWMMKK